MLITQYVIATGIGQHVMKLSVLKRESTLFFAIYRPYIGCTYTRKSTIVTLLLANRSP